MHLGSGLELVRLLGWRWIVFRVWHAAKLKSGWFRLRTPCRAWEACRGWQFRGCTLPVFAAAAEVSIRDAERILNGEICYFFRHWVRTGFPPDWVGGGKRLIGTNGTLLGVEGRHWSRIDDAGDVDIKVVWESSRFAFAFPLARAYEATKDEKYAEGFWEAVEDWRDKNPPNSGPNWMCGQEIAIRMIAWLHGYGLLRHSQATTEARALMLAQMVAVAAERIEANIGYARSQNNNHGISEAAGLFTAGVAVGRNKWIEKGRRLLERQARRLIYEDGSFSQHSVNYHRVMLDVYHWVLELGGLNAVHFGEELHRRVARAEKWLEAMTDTVTGRAPNLGSNDGAWVLPGTGYLEYRLNH